MFAGDAESRDPLALDAPITVKKEGGRTTFRCPNDYCMRLYQSKGSLIRHLRLGCQIPDNFNIEPEPNGSFKCTRCQRLYKAKSTLLRHLRYECNVAPKFQCQICGIRFKQKFSILVHMKLVHGYVDD